MKTIAAVMVLSVAVLVSPWAFAQGIPVDGTVPAVQVVPSVVYAAPVIYNGPVVYNAPVVYEAPVQYALPGVAYPPAPVLWEIAPDVYQFTDKVLIISSPMYYDALDWGPPCPDNVIYFGGRQGRHQGYNFSHPR